MKMKTQPKTYGIQFSKSSGKRKDHSNTSLPQETRKTSNIQPNFTPKTTGERTTTKNPQISRRKEIIST